MYKDIHGGTPAHRRTRSLNAVLLGCTALVAFTPVSLKAQDATSTDGSTVLETITVEGSGSGDDSRTIIATRSTGGGKMATDVMDTAASVSVITSKEIQQRGAQDVEQVLQYTAGVTADFYGSDDRFDYFKIRGFDAYLYRDGLMIGDPFGGIREEPFAYERVEVLKGASSSSFGVSDPGGSVNFVTKRPKSERFGEAYVTGGSYGRAETGIDFGDNITEDDTLSYRLTGKVKNADAEYDYSRDDEKFFMGGLTWRPTDVTNLSVVYDHLNRDGTPGSGGHPLGTNFDRSVFFGEPDYNFRTTNRNNLSVMFDHDFGSGLTINSNARYSNTRSDFGYAYISDANTDGDTTVNRYYFGDNSAEEDFVIDTRLQYDASFGNVDSRTLVGVEYSHRTADNQLFYDGADPIDWTNPIYTGGRPTFAGPYTDTKNKQDNKALYVQQDFTFSEKLIASVALRNDWMDLEQTNNLTGVTDNGDISELSTKVGLAYKFTDEFMAFASYAQSAVPSDVFAEAELGEQFEVGAKYRPESFPALLTASVYDLTRKNFSVTDPVTYVATTIGEARVRGIDLEAKAEINDNWSLTAGYSYLDTKIVDSGPQDNDGNRLALVPEHIATLWLNYSLEGNDKRGDLTVGLGGRYLGSYYFGDVNTGKAESSVVFDAALSYEVVENTTLEFNVSNLFNEKYVANGGAGADFYNPGRAFSATLRKTW